MMVVRVPRLVVVCLTLGLLAGCGYAAHGSGAPPAPVVTRGATGVEVSSSAPTATTRAAVTVTTTITRTTTITTRPTLWVTVTKHPTKRPMTVRLAAVTGPC